MVDQQLVWRIPLVGEFTTSDPSSWAVEDTACDPLAPYVATEVELERLNLARTNEEVLWKKLVEVKARLLGAEDITLDGAGRITTWNEDPLDPSKIVPTAIDASPDHAAIYAAAVPDVAALEGGPGEIEKLGGLMDTGSIPDCWAIRRLLLRTPRIRRRSTTGCWQPQPSAPLRASRFRSRSSTGRVLQPNCCSF